MLFLLAAASAAATELPPTIVTAPDERATQFTNYYNSEVKKSDELEVNDHLDQLHFQGLTHSGATARARYFQIRGIGERSSYEAMPNESVSVLLDHVDYTGVGGVLDLVGMKSVELYKGPQNTLIGPSSLAGMIVGTTKSGEENKLTIGSELKTYRGVALSAEAENRYQRGQSFLSLSYKQEDGYFHNEYLNRKDTNHIDELALKAKLDFKPFSLSMHYFDFQNGYDIFNFENSKKTISDKPGQDAQKTFGASLVHTKNFGRTTFESIIGGHLTKTGYSYDEDWGNNTYWQQLPGWNDVYNYNIEFNHDIKTLSLEERVSYEQGSLFHRSGLYAKFFSDDSRELGFKNDGVRKDVQGDFSRERYSLYHETEYSHSSTLHFFMGGRIEQVNSRYRDNKQNSFSPKEFLWGARLGAQLALHPLHNLTVNLARGYKPGGVNIGSAITADRREFHEENLYQLDVKISGKFDYFSYSTEFFYTLREDIQVETSYQDNPSDPSSFTFYTDNGVRGRSYGNESSVSWNNFSFWSTQARFSVLQSEYGSYRHGSRSLKGRSFSYAPEYTWSLKNTWRLVKGLEFNLEHDFQKSFYFGNSHDEQSPSRLITSANLTYSHQTWKAIIWGRNIFNEREESRGFYFGNRPPSFSNEKFVQVGSPAIYGLKVLKTF